MKTPRDFFFLGFFYQLFVLRLFPVNYSVKCCRLDVQDKRFFFVIHIFKIFRYYFSVVVIEDGLLCPVDGEERLANGGVEVMCNALYKIFIFSIHSYIPVVLF